ncbi:MAG: hypothetical protein WDO69_32490 [Pseudomonadota bacterium]
MKTAQVYFVAHLSSSGFAAPIGYTLRWLQKQHPDQNTAAFWDLLFNRVRFDLSHMSGPPSAQGIGDSRPRIYFSYGHRPQSGPSQIPSEWQPYLLSAEGGASIFPIPVDRLVLTTSAIQKLLTNRPVDLKAGDDGLDKDSLKGVPIDGFRENSFAEYKALNEVHLHDSDSFDAQLACIWGQAQNYNAHCESIPPGRQALADRYKAWYLNREFRFPLPDLMKLLAQEHVNEGQDSSLALILPGGGVKSAYQAKILDALYGGPGYLLPGDSEKLRAQAVNSGVRSNEVVGVPVSAVIGTSGGAMMGVFAAQLDDHPKPITPNWVLKNGLSAISERNIFPFLGPLRLASLFVWLLVFGITLKWARVAVLSIGRKLHEAPGDNPSRYAPRGTTIFAMLGLWLCAGAVVPIIAAHGGNKAPYTASAEFLMFFGCGLLAHFVWTCCSSVERDAIKYNRPLQRTMGVVTIVCAPLAIVLLAVAWFAAPTHHEIAAAESLGVSVWWPSLAAMLAAWLAWISFVGYFYSFSRESRLVGIRQYLKALRVFLWGLCGTTVIFSAGLATGLYTMLEVTPRFWFAVVITAAATAVLCVSLASLPFEFGLANDLREGIKYLRSSQVIMNRRTTPARTLLLFIGLTVFGWIGVVSPALYDSAGARRFFQAQVQRWAGGPETTGARLHSNLIVTATTLGSFSAGGEQHPPGDVYFCFDGASPCPPLRTFRFHRSASTWSDLIDRVFASGSPFPVFPEFQIGGEKADIDGKFVDGGYAHNVPIDAARMVGAHEALVIYSEPRESQKVEPMNDFPVARLTRNAPRLIPFMFDRSQQADRDGEEGMVVAGIAPLGDGSPFPFLTEFRADVVQRMVGCAECDLGSNAAMGFVESWGLPRVFKTVGSRQKLTLRDEDGWSPQVQEASTARSYGRRAMRWRSSTWTTPCWLTTSVTRYSEG